MKLEDLKGRLQNIEAAIENTGRVMQQASAMLQKHMGSKEECLHWMNELAKFGADKLVDKVIPDNTEDEKK